MSFPCLIMHYFQCSILSSFAIILTKKRELLALFNCLHGVLPAIVMWLFLAVLWVGMQCVSVVFPDQTHFLLVLKAKLAAVHVALSVVSVKVLSDLHCTMRMQCSGMYLSCRTPSCPVGNSIC